MFHYHRFKAILNPQTPTCYLLHRTHFLTTTSDSDQQSFTVSYLTNTCGLSPQKALIASKQFRFNTPNKPDSVIAFFKTHGFSNDQIQSTIHKAPILLTFDPIKTILPKFQFLSTKGASSSDIVETVTRAPNFLRASLDKQIIPAFELVRSFCPSDQKALTSIIACPSSISDIRMKPNIQLLLDFGAPPASIYRLLTTRPSIICSNDLRKVLEEIKELGFDPSSYKFCMALLAKKAITKSQWDAKVDALKSWGCSEDQIFNAFKKQPSIMLRSPDKLNAVMRFWTKQLGWDPLLLLSAPDLFGFSIEKRFIPRASVVQYLLSKGLMKKDASLISPFYLTDELFRQRYMDRFKEEAYRLLKLYKGEDSSIRCLDKLSKHILVCREKQRKESCNLQPVNRKLSAMNKLLMEENDRLQKQVSQLVCENEYMRHQVQSGTRAPNDGSCESAVPTPQHSLRDTNSPTELLYIAEETLSEYLCKATRTAVDWVQMPVMKVEPAKVADAAYLNPTKLSTEQIVEILKDRPCWFRDFRSLEVFTMIPTSNGGTIELVYMQTYAQPQLHWLLHRVLDSSIHNYVGEW